MFVNYLKDCQHYALIKLNELINYTLLNGYMIA